MVETGYPRRQDLGELAYAHRTSTWQYGHLRAIPVGVFTFIVSAAGIPQCAPAVLQAGAVIIASSIVMAFAQAHLYDLAIRKNLHAFASIAYRHSAWKLYDDFEPSINERGSWPKTCIRMVENMSGVAIIVGFLVCLISIPLISPPRLIYLFFMGITVHFFAEFLGYSLWVRTYLPQAAFDYGFHPDRAHILSDLACKRAELIDRYKSFFVTEDN